MKTLPIGLLVVLASGALQAQRCGSDAYLKHLEYAQPGIGQAVRSLSTLQSKKTRATVRYIPVVFHIVYKNSTENLTDNYINAQIDQLNRCYGRTNSDTSSMRAVFQPIVGPARIQFILDQIIRVPTTNTSFDAGGFPPFEGSDMVKFTSAGGSDAVSPTTKLNVWVCDLKLGGQDVLIGYAYPPPGLPNWGGQGNTNPSIDGVVMDYLDIGGPSRWPKGNAAYGFQGKSLVHEVGHYLGLRHIWGDDGGACFGQQDYEDDGITDTPEQGDQSPDNCNKNMNSCIQSPNDMPDMVENYMDYSSASCQNSFTKGQVTLMENVLSTIRTTIMVPTGLGQEVNSETMIVYPNPARDRVVVQLNGQTFAQGTLSLINLTGQTLRRFDLESGREMQEFPVNDLPRGVYIMQAVVDQQSLFTRKLILE